MLIWSALQSGLAERNSSIYLYHKVLYSGLFNKWTLYRSLLYTYILLEPRAWPNRPLLGTVYKPIDYGL